MRQVPELASRGQGFVFQEEGQAMQTINRDQAAFPQVNPDCGTANFSTARQSNSSSGPVGQFRRTWHKLASFTIGMAFILSAGSAGATETVLVIGIGSGTCASFLEDIEAKPQTQGEYFSWAQGYMSGLLVRAPIGENVNLNPDLLPLPKQAVFLRMFCTSNENARFADGAELLYKMLRRATVQ